MYGTIKVSSVTFADDLKPMENVTHGATEVVILNVTQKMVDKLNVEKNTGIQVLQRPGVNMKCISYDVWREKDWVQHVEGGDDEHIKTWGKVGMVEDNKENPDLTYTVKDGNKLFLYSRVEGVKLIAGDKIVVYLVTGNFV